MELCLASNNPAHTLLITQDGIPAYSIQTSQDGPSSSSHQETILKTTNVTRLERRSSGRTETQVGQILYFGIDRLRLSLQYNDKEEFKLEVLNIQGDSSVDLGSSNSWSFTGPDDKPYKWQIFIQYPVLLLDDNSQTPIARYRRAKLGIVSRPRKPFLEIFPAGINCIDLIVATFVSYMIQKFPQITQTR